MSARAALLLLVVGGCAALGTGDGLDPLPTRATGDAGADGGAQLRVELGTGVETYEPLADGALVDVVLGPQGGFHVWTSVRVHDPTLVVARIDLSARFADDGRPAGPPSSVTAPLVLVGTACEHTGMTSFIADPARVRGQRVVLHVEVLVPDGRRGSAERTVIPR